MRDTYGTNDLRDDMTGPLSGSAVAGMRHSIRPRRAAGSKQAPLAEVPVTLPAAPTEVAAPRHVTVAEVETFAPMREIERAARAGTRKPGADLDADFAAPGRYCPDPSLPRWHELSLVEIGSRQTARTAMPVADAARDSDSVRAFDLLRTRLRQTTQENGWTNIAVVSPTSGCGNTFTAVNLALSLSRISKSRTVLMDLNLRNPSVGKAFDVCPRGSMSDFLAGRTPIGDHMVRVSDTLALGLNNQADPNAADTLQTPEAARTLERMRAALQPELVIYDLPAMLVHDDLSAFLPQLDGVLLVSDGTQTMGRDLLECERRLEGRVPLLGVVLNRAREDSIPRYN